MNRSHVRAGRPGFYMRWYFSYYSYYGDGNLYNIDLADPADETFDRSYERWVIGARFMGRSMPEYQGHALQAYDAAIIGHIKQTGLKEGFLMDRISLGPSAQRPTEGEKGVWHMWINTDPPGEPGADKAFVSHGEAWVENHVSEVACAIDLSVPWVRQIILEDKKRYAQESFAKYPDEQAILATEPEDGDGHSRIEKQMAYKNWYPDYLEAEGVPFGQPYVLHGFHGLDQPSEVWDPSSSSDMVFGFNNWLLREMDKWIDSLPPEQRVTATGKSKKDLLCTTLYSYVRHDVPPDFNLDARIRVQIAGFARNRGRGKWNGVVDDLKTFWYFHYLLQSGKGTADSREMREFAWKGQMANMLTMAMVVPSIFGTSDAREAAGPEFRSGPAHYTHQETQAWWQKVLDFWKLPDADLFTDMTLADGRKGASVDLNDLVAVCEFAGAGPDTVFADNTYYKESTRFYTVALRKGDPIGFKIHWPSWDTLKKPEQRYGLDRWDARTKQWASVRDKDAPGPRSQTVAVDWGWTEGDRELVEVRLDAPAPGTYRFDLGARRGPRVSDLARLRHGGRRVRRRDASPHLRRADVGADPGGHLLLHTEGHAEPGLRRVG